jgi:hypothetical protein
MFLRLSIAILCAGMSFASVFAQSKKEDIDVPGSIVMIECKDCPETILKLPATEYPSYVGYGPQKHTGNIHVQVTITADGMVREAKAVAGHPYFRPLLEQASLGAMFGSEDADRKAIITYRVSAPYEGSLSGERLGIVNGRARTIPKPFYSKQLEQLCAFGRVDVRLKIGETGAVEYAVPVSGDPLLSNSATSTAFRAEFTGVTHGPVATEGILSLNFEPITRCVDVGIVNNKIRTIQLPPIHGHARVLEATTLDVRVSIDLGGNVVAAGALSGHPLLRVPFERAALSAKFFPTLINTQPFLLKGTIRFKISKSGKVSYKSR